MQKIRILIDWFKKNFLKKDFFKFLIIGVINTFNGTILATVLSLIMNANLAFILGYILSLIIAYGLNSWFVFQQKLDFGKLLKFMISYVPNFIIQNTVVIFFFNILLWPKIIAFFLAAILGIPLTFLILKYFTFDKKKI